MRATGVGDAGSRRSTLNRFTIAAFAPFAPAKTTEPGSSVADPALASGRVATDQIQAQGISTAARKSQENQTWARVRRASPNPVTPAIKSNATAAEARGRRRTKPRPVTSP